MANTKITSDNLDTLTTLTVDDITLDGSTISDAGDLTIDVGGDLTIDVDGADIKFADGGTEFADHFLDGSDYKIQTTISNGDFIIVGNDSGSAITAFTLDMSQAGRATFNEGVVCKSSTGGDFGVNINTASGDSMKLQVVDTGTGGAANGVITVSDGDLILSPSANVGIGTTSPDGLLHISSGNSGDAIVIIQADEDNNEEGDNPQLWFKADGDITEAAIRQADNELQFISNVSVSGGFSFLTGTSDNTGTTDPATGATEKLKIRPDGNVGIGDNDPPYKLSVSGTGGTRIMVENTDTNWAALDIRAGGNQANYVFFKDDSAERARMQVFDTNDIAFSTGDSPTERLRINNAGIVTKPYQPAFHAYGPTSASTPAYIVFQNTSVNTGSHYSTSTGKFTVPVTGVYLLYWSAIGNNNNDVYRYYLRVNQSANISNTGGDVHLRVDTLATGSEYGTNGSRVQMLSLSANDEVQIYFQSDSGNTTYVGSDYVNFGGYLIG